MTSIDIMLDKIANLERVDAIQNSKIKQLEIECDSLRSMLKCWTKPLSDWNTRQVAGFHLDASFDEVDG